MCGATGDGWGGEGGGTRVRPRTAPGKGLSNRPPARSAPFVCGSQRPTQEIPRETEVNANSPQHRPVRCSCAGGFRDPRRAPPRGKQEGHAVAVRAARVWRRQPRDRGADCRTEPQGPGALALGRLGSPSPPQAPPSPSHVTALTYCQADGEQQPEDEPAHHLRGHRWGPAAPSRGARLEGP